jgi:DNA-binding transcriptional ArsR family regulator
MNLLAKLFSSKVRAEVFRLLFRADAKPLHLREIQRQAGMAVGTIQQELAKLEQLGLIQRRVDGNRVYFNANVSHPLASELRGLVDKTVGVVALLGTALASERVRWIFVFGSMATGQARPESDIDVMIVGDVTLRVVARSLSEVVPQLGREVNPCCMSFNEFLDRRKKNDHFITTVLNGPRLWIKGNDDELNAMA